MTSNRSNRLKYRIQIANALRERTWAEARACLEEFEGGHRYDWEDDLHSYVLEMTSEMSFGALQGLAEHLSGEVGLKIDPDATELPKFWKPNQLKVFISHLATHKEAAGRLQDELTLRGISGFVAHEDIEPTTEWQREIERALQTCDVLLALLHEDFHASNWTDHEIGFALGRRIPVFSVKIGTEPYGLFGKTQAFAGFNKTEAQLAIEIFHACRIHPQAAPFMGEVLISFFEQSKTKSNAAQRAKWLEEMPFWKIGFGERLIKSLDENQVLSKAPEVTKTIQALVQKQEPSVVPAVMSFDDEIPF